MQTLGVIALVLGLASFVAGIVAYALNGAARPDENAPGAGEADLDLFTMNDEPAEAAIQHPGATGGTDSGPAAATHTAGN